jgi:nitroreductase
MDAYRAIVDKRDQRCAQNMMLAAWADGVGSCPAHPPEGQVGALLIDPEQAAPPRSVGWRA